MKPLLGDNRPSCSFEGCTRPHEAKSLCRAHYKQWLTTGRLKPIRARISSEKVFDSDGNKWCSGCRRYQRPSDFYQRAESKNGLSHWCKSCESIQGRLKNYQLTPEAFEALLIQQGGACALCKSKDPGGKGTWHVDHDHRCCPYPGKSCGKCVRGLLCHGCNLGLGNFEDDINRLKAAIAYLERHGQESETSASA
jgi:hypothetical protein